MKVSVNKADLASLNIALIGIKNGSKKVVRRAINKTLTNTKTAASKEIRKDLNLKASRVNKDFTVQRARYPTTSGALIAKGRPVGLVQYGARQIKKGVSVKVHKKKKRSLLRHAFIAHAKGAKHAFWRARVPAQRAKFIPGFAYARLPDRYRFPLERLTGPRIEDEFAKDSVMKPVLRHADRRMTINLNQELNFELSKLR